MIRVMAVMFVLGAMAAAGDLSAIKDEPNLTKRSSKALDNALEQIEAASKAYAQGDMEKTRAALAEVVDSVELSYESLQQTGKNPRRSPKHFKRAEVKTREMLRRLHSISTEFSVDDRPMLEKVEARIQQVHDELLASIFTKKK